VYTVTVCDPINPVVNPIPVSYSRRTSDNIKSIDLLCGLVVRVSCYRSRGPGVDPDFIRSSWSGTGSTQPREDN
jgi:hypothetical protein